MSDTNQKVSNSCNSCGFNDQKTLMERVNWIAFHWPNYVSVVIWYMFIFMLFIAFISSMFAGITKGKTTKSPEDEL